MRGASRLSLSFWRGRLSRPMQGLCGTTTRDPHERYLILVCASIRAIPCSLPHEISPYTFIRTLSI